MSDEVKTEESWRPYEPERVLVYPSSRKRTVMFWIAEVERSGAVGPFETSEQAEAWVREWSVKARAAVVPVFCPIGVQGLIGLKFIKAGHVMPELSELGDDTVYTTEPPTPGEPE
jgi:hypothetical protein